MTRLTKAIGLFAAIWLVVLLAYMFSVATQAVLGVLAVVAIIGVIFGLCYAAFADDDYDSRGV